MMRFITVLKLFIGLPSFMLIVLLSLFSCTQNQDRQAYEHPADRLNPDRNHPPYPSITIPEEADMESPRWKGINLDPVPPVVPKSVIEAQETFVLQPGYEISPVLTEPQIKEPAAIQFDGNGRMYVLELRSYMQDIDATGELEPVSRISRWEDTDNDGVYDKGVVFLDSLVFPRFILPFGPNTILSMESNEDIVYKYIDTDNDGKADEKHFFADGLGRTGNVEHQTSFLTWTLDNWMYSTYNPVRIKWTPEGVIKESSGTPYGQWGVTQDNYGRVWIQGGASGVPFNFQYHIAYGNYGSEDLFEPGFRSPFSLVKLADFEPGMREAHPDGSLNNVTGAAGNDVFRGHRMPHDLINQYIYGEPVARIVRRVKSQTKEGIMTIQNAYIDQKSEFIQSTDPLFRPTDMATAPDGTLYIVDMYRGIIQEGNWTQEGSYLRTKILQYQMDDIVGNGRIWRLSHTGIDRDMTQPRMFEESTETLVQHLRHPNGWWRDKAQQLIILRQDKSVIPLLVSMVEKEDNELARIHALWTLEGLNGLDPSLITNLLKDQSGQMRRQAIRASETLYKFGQLNLEKQYVQLLLDRDTEVVIQAMLTLSVINPDLAQKEISSLLQNNKLAGIQLLGQQIIEKIEEKNQLASAAFTPAERISFIKGKEIYDGLCSTCHGIKGLGALTGNGALMAPALASNERVTDHPAYVTKTLLHGLTGDIEGKTYEGLMIAMNSNNDEWIASVLSYIRNDWGNSAEFVSPNYVARVRSETKNRTESYTYDELKAEVPHLLLPNSSWVTSASSTALRGVGSTRNPDYALSFKGWKTEDHQDVGMYYQVQFPTPMEVSALSFESDQDQAPRDYILVVSMDGRQWQEVGHSKGKDGQNYVDIKEPAVGSYFRFELKKKTDHPWMMKNVMFYARPGHLIE